ncbi:EamA family transporter [Nocardioides bruguierae]|uniref:EamA family transporter n=1 Tax=Nocardioides bruguierae TaxID=2945102 RepID=UPI0020217310|nr:EamA family transporter [Nocardioides bruguierae]MCL8026520.1 EamA family transporter [Nocardioides bruguierae]
MTARSPAPAAPRPRVPPVVLVLIGIASVQLGAGVAKSLFDEASPTTLVWLRLVTSSVLLLAFVRPRVRGRSRADWGVVLAFGASLGLMNWAIYQSFARIPLGVAVTLEFVGPLLLAVAGSRRARDLVWVGLAGLGVALLGLGDGGLTLVGALLALLAGAAWATYILASARTGAAWEGLDGLAVASTVATLGLTPFVLGPVATGGHDAALTDPHVLLLGAAVGLLSSVVPYSCELVALRTLRPSVFGILMSLEPAAAALAGLLVLGELLGAAQWAAIVCVVVASVGATRSGGPPGEPAVVPDPSGLVPVTERSHGVSPEAPERS